MRRACIDIGSNTTRLLVAECSPQALHEVHQEREFNYIGAGKTLAGAIAKEKIEQVARVVAAQLRTARALGAVEVRGVATGAFRSGQNGEALTAAVRAACDLDVEVLSAQDEARLAFIGAARTLDHVPDGDLGVVDVGGGSSELAVGTPPDNVSWCASFSVGSGVIADRCLHSDPPSESELLEARASVSDTLGDLHVPRPAEAVAVGGSAASLRRLAGPLLDGPAFTRALALLAHARAAEIATSFALDVERVRLLPAGLLILQAASELFGRSLLIGYGGLREGLLLEAEHA